MNELIKTIRRDDGTIAVSGRELHDFLEVDTPYTQWFDRMIDYGFTENTDFKGLSQKSEKLRTITGKEEMPCHCYRLLKMIRFQAKSI